MTREGRESGERERGLFGKFGSGFKRARAFPPKTMQE